MASWNALLITIPSNLLLLISSLHFNSTKSKISWGSLYWTVFSKEIPYFISYRKSSSFSILSFSAAANRRYSQKSGFSIDNSNTFPEYCNILNDTPSLFKRRLKYKLSLTRYASCFFRQFLISFPVLNSWTQLLSLFLNKSTNSKILEESTTFEKSAVLFFFHIGRISITFLSTKTNIGIPFDFALKYSKLVIDLFPWSVIYPYLPPTMSTIISALCSTTLRQLLIVSLSGSIGKESYSDNIASYPKSSSIKSLISCLICFKS